MVHPDINIIDIYKMFNILFWFLITNSKKARHVRHVNHCKMHVFKETFSHRNIKSIIVMYCWIVVKVYVKRTNFDFLSPT